MATFEQEEAAFYELIGRTIDQWVYVETTLFHIFQFVLATPQEDRGAAVFYSQINFRAKLDMTDAALRTFLGERLLTEWSRLFKRLKKKSTKRNKLAQTAI